MSDYIKKLWIHFLLQQVMQWEKKVKIYLYVIFESAADLHITGKPILTIIVPASVRHH